MKQFTCTYCGATFMSKSSSRLAEHTFCSMAHYHAWRIEQNPANRFDRDARLREYDTYKRLLWGGSGKKAKEVGAWAKPFGARFEDYAETRILPREHFTQIDNWSNRSNQFLIDFVATRDELRVLVDVTTKWSAYIPQKTALARSLRMPLYILHVSPANPDVYWLVEVSHYSKVSKVPMRFFHQLYEASGLALEGWPDKNYHNVHKRSERAKP